MAFCKPNIHVSLSQERSYVKHTQMYTKAHILDALDALLEISDDEIGDDALSQAALSPKKRRTESNWPQHVPARLHCDTTCSHDLQSRHVLSNNGIHSSQLYILSTNAYSLQMMLFLFMMMTALCLRTLSMLC